MSRARAPVQDIAARSIPDSLQGTRFPITVTDSYTEYDPRESESEVRQVRFASNGDASCRQRDSCRGRAVPFRWNGNAGFQPIVLTRSWRESASRTKPGTQPWAGRRRNNLSRRRDRSAHERAVIDPCRPCRSQDPQDPVPRLSRLHPLSRGPAQQEPGISQSSLWIRRCAIAHHSSRQVARTGMTAVRSVRNTRKIQDPQDRRWIKRTAHGRRDWSMHHRRCVTRGVMPGEFARRPPLTLLIAIWCLQPAPASGISAVPEMWPSG